MSRDAIWSTGLPLSKTVMMASLLLIISVQVKILNSIRIFSRMRDRDIIRRFRDMMLRKLNREIDKSFHRYFEDPDKCLQAVFLDTYTHQAVESILGLPPKEIARRTRKYFPKALEKCLNAILRKATK